MNVKFFNIKRHWKPLAAVAGFTAMIIYTAGLFSSKTPPDRLEVKPGRALPANAVLVDVVQQPRASRIEVVGTTASERRIQISSRLSASVEEVLVNAGDRVQAGQNLVRLDDRELREQLTAAEAQLDNASAEYRRTRQLMERNATTEQALTAAESAYNSAKAQAERIRVLISYTTVTAPINGIVTERRIEAGDLASPGQLLLVIFDPANMRLEVPVPVRLVPKFELGQPYRVVLDYPAQEFAATVTEIVGELDPVTRTRRVKLRLEDANGLVLPGTFGRIWIEGDAEPAIFIPADAVVRIGQLDMVDIAVDGRIIRRMIKTGRAAGGEVEVLSGLAGGERLVITESAGE